MIKLLFICTHNRCRSILSEAITNHFFSSGFIAQSAGSQPVGEVHPLTIKYLQESGIETDNLHSKSWDTVEAFSPDIVITVCDSAAGEACPVWFGQSVKVHWGLQDPSTEPVGNEEIRDKFTNTINSIKYKVNKLLKLNLSTLPRDQWADRIQQSIQ